MLVRYLQKTKDVNHVLLLRATNWTRVWITPSRTLCAVPSFKFFFIISRFWDFDDPLMNGSYEDFYHWCSLSCVPNFCGGNNFQHNIIKCIIIYYKLDIIMLCIIISIKYNLATKQSEHWDRCDIADCESKTTLLKRSTWKFIDWNTGKILETK